MTSNHRVASREEWLRERLVLLDAEKKLTHLRDDLAQRRRDLPWVAVEKDYRFDGPDGQLSLADLFGTASQLIRRARPAPLPAHPRSSAMFGRSIADTVLTLWGGRTLPTSGPVDHRHAKAGRPHEGSM